MKKIVSLIGLIIEFAILIGLLWKHFRLYDLTVAVVLLLIFPVLELGHWSVLKKQRFAQNVRLKLFFLTGPAIFLSMSLILNINFEMKKYAIIRGASKEMAEEARKEGVPHEFYQQWIKDSVDRMKSE